MTFRRWPIGQRVLVNLEDGRAFDATMISRHGELLELAGATLIEPHEEPTPLDGRVFIERIKVSFIQVRG